MAKKKADPFLVSLTKEKQAALAQRLSDEIDYALEARLSIIGEGGDLDYYTFYYEQGRSAASQQRWPGAADLISYIVTVSVDAMRARMVKTIFDEPFYIVEGFGDSASKAQFVEEIDQWWVEQERLQTKQADVIHTSLIDGTCIFEVAERSQKRKTRQQEDVALELDGDGAPILDDKHQPTLKRHPETGDFVPPQEGEPSASVVVERMKTTRKGPQYRIVNLRDFVFLPGHAKDESEVWGKAKRFTRRVPELKALEKLGVYENVDQLGTMSDVQPTGYVIRDGQQIAAQDGDSVEKELWELQVLLDLDEDGIEEYYLVTLSKEHRVLLRCQHDDLGQERYLAYIPFRKPGSMYGYSLVQKILTIAEEHTAVRNMIADRSSLVTNAPLTRVQGALWDPIEQPFGPGRVLDVRDHNEVKAMQIPDVPQSAVLRENSILQAHERVSGQNDIAIGGSPEVGRTATEINVRTEQSFVRMDEAIRLIQETNEDLGQLRHQIYVRMLEDEQDGIEPPSSLVRSLEMKGAQIPVGKITADMIKGTFRFKPRGSTATADLNREQQSYNQWLETMGHLAQMFPPLMALFSRDDAVRALLEQGLRVNRVRDRQAFLPPVGTPIMPPPMLPGLPGQMPGQPALPGAPPAPGAAPASMPPQLQALLGGVPPPQGPV